MESGKSQLFYASFPHEWPAVLTSKVKFGPSHKQNTDWGENQTTHSAIHRSLSLNAPRLCPLRVELTQARVAMQVPINDVMLNTYQVYTRPSPALHYGQQFMASPGR